MAQGDAVVHISAKNLGQLLIALPPLAEQRAIAEVLSDMDAQIAALDALIAKKRDIKQGAMQELLTGRRRLPGFSGAWETRRLGEIADLDPETLGVNTPLDYVFTYISLEDVDHGVLRNSSQEVFRTAPSRARRKVKEKDILFSTVRPNLGSHLFIHNAMPDLVCSTGFTVLRYKRDIIEPVLMYFHLFSTQIQKQLDKLISGSNYPAVNSSDVGELEIVLPLNIEEQTGIAGALSDMDDEIAALEAQRRKTADLKQAMMHELLTGKTRLI